MEAVGLALLLGGVVGGLAMWGLLQPKACYLLR